MNTFRIAFIAIRELLYERVFYIILSFSVLSLGLSLALGQMTFAEQAKLTLDFMLAGIQISMCLFSVFVGISLLQKEMQLGSVSMVLSKPISRSTFLMGKFMGQVCVQLFVIVFMSGITLGISAFYGTTSLFPIIQAVLLIFLEVTVLTAVTYLFAVNAGALTAAVVTLCVFVIGHSSESVSKNLGNLDSNWIWKVGKAFVPDLEVFNMKSLASYGLSISSTEIMWTLLYAAVCICFYLGVAMLCFQRKDILT